MKIVGVAACTAGIAHTYIAKEKLEVAAKERGHQISIETQGLAGSQDKLKDSEIKEADVVILAVDIRISGRERFTNKRVIEVPTAVVVKSPNKLVEKVEAIVKGGE